MHTEEIKKLRNNFFEDGEIINDWNDIANYINYLEVNLVPEEIARQAILEALMEFHENFYYVKYKTKE